MQQKETILINAQIQSVWNFIEDPNNLQLWNPKVRRVTAFGNSGKSVGSNFGIMYMMNNSASEMRGEVIVHEPTSRLTFRFSDGKMQHGRGRIIMWIVFKTGKPVGEPYLVKLRDLIEKK
ncbi:MAG: SRPBCC family protein [Ignavibacteriales bacterium]|nr:SRPBCC family protein [Ignavibacteriales bacterium]